MRAWGYAKRLKEGKGSELARLCWEELKEKGKLGKVGLGWKKKVF